MSPTQCILLNQWKKLVTKLIVISEEENWIFLHIHFKECPLGFNIAKNNESNWYECQCHDSAIRNCSITSQTVTKKQYSWLGTFKQDNRSYLAASNYCPLDYCKPDFVDLSLNSGGLDEDKQCQYNRTGVLCGGCPEGWSLVLGSSECRENCSSVWLLLILPFALAGLLLVVVIHLLNLTVTTGTVCGLIFYANIVRDYSVEIFSHPIPGLTPILRIFLAWLNLDFGIATCFYEGMEAFGKTVFSLCFPSLHLVDINHHHSSQQSLHHLHQAGRGKCNVKVLSTLILLSYSKDVTHHNECVSSWSI